MNVLHVVHYPVFGGPHNQAMRLASPLRARGWQTTVLLPDEPGNAGPRLQAAGLDIVTMPLGRLRATPNPIRQFRFTAGFISDVQRIRRLIRDRSIHLVVVAGLVNTQSALAARMDGVPVVWQLVDTRPPMLLRRLLMPLVTRLAGSIMTTGMATAAAHPGALMQRRPVVPFFPPVDCTVFQPQTNLRSE